ncbi:MAG: peptidylprolyl isomerase [Betaproteobacteria bacterium]|nr:peptidylprolyl isomerase [Betaproteobacteria bacterium]
MARRRPALSLLAAVAAAGVAAFASAQPTTSGGSIQVPGAGPRPGKPPAARPAAPPRPATATVPLDRVIAVVNDEALTQFELDEQKRIVLAQMKTANVRPPAPDALEAQVLERLIVERALLQFAKDNGVRVDDQTVERTILRIAQENKVSPEELRRVLDREKISYAKYREDIRREVTIQRLREREVDSRVQVSEAEVENYLATVAAQAGGENEYLLSHIMVGVPDQATPDQIDVRRRRAEEALAQLKSGKEFSQVAAAYSDAQDAIQGGDLGWRTPARLPTVFQSAVRTMSKGDVSPVLRSAGGFHIVKVNDSRSRNAPTIVDQTHARHILVRVNEVTSESEAKAKIDRVKDRIEQGAKFADQAKVNSEDGSSSKGGDLGWISPGDTVPEFEQAMAKLKIGEMSGPVRTPFGWHLILVEERRTQDVTEARKRDQARQAIRARKADEQFGEFMRQVRDKAYVEYKIDDK